MKLRRPRALRGRGRATAELEARLRAADERVAKLRRKVASLKESSDKRVAKAYRSGYSAGPLLDMGYPGAELKLVSAASSRQDEHESEPYIPEWIEQWFEPGDTFYDIGANVGTYALIAAAVALPEGRVYAFEPSFSTYAVLCENVRVNGLGDRVTTLPVALGDGTGLVTFDYSSTRPGAAKHNWPSGAVGYSHSVLGYRLDELVRDMALSPPTHVKIDTDGGEPALLRGAGALLAAPSLRSLMVELLTWTENEVVGLLGEHGFSLVQRYERPPSPVTCGLFARGESPPPGSAGAPSGHG